jgi:hypothetical protein
MSGKWIERSPMYLSFDIYNCDYCGKNIPRSIWLETIDSSQVPFCSPEVAKVFLRSRNFPQNTRKEEGATGLMEELREVRNACSALQDRRESAQESNPK